MNKKYIYFKADSGQELKRTSELYTSPMGTINYLAAHFDIADFWLKYDRLRVVWNFGKSGSAESEIDVNGNTIIPSEMLSHPGTLYVNLCASDVVNGSIVARLTSYKEVAVEVVRTEL